MQTTSTSSLDNTIISKDAARVKWSEKKSQNIKIAKRFLHLANSCNSKAETLLRSGEELQALTERTAAENFRKRGFRMQDCARFIKISVCPACHRSIGSSASLCRDRVCPTCAWRLSAQQGAEMLHTLSFINDLTDYDALFLTLTVKNCAGELLADTLALMSAAWNRLLSRRKNRAMIKGTARAVEITYNKNTRTFHPHYHVIILVDKLKHSPHTTGVLNAYFNKEWQTAAKLAYIPITDIRTIENKALAEYDTDEAARYKKAILETFKYTIKDDNLAEMPLSQFRQYVEAVQGKRLVAYTGIIKEARAELDFTDELQSEDETRYCPDCSGEMLSAIYQWSFKESTYKRFLQAVE